MILIVRCMSSSSVKPDRSGDLQGGCFRKAIPYASPPVFGSRTGQMEKGAQIYIGGGPWLSAWAAWRWISITGSLRDCARAGNGMRRTQSKTEVRRGIEKEGRIRIVNFRGEIIMILAVSLAKC